MQSSSSVKASQNQETSSSSKLEKKLNWKKIIAGLLVFVFLFFFVAIFVAYSFVHRYLQSFESSAKVPVSEIYQQVRLGLKADNFSQQSNLTILLLGTDQLANREGDPILTDTMMILNLNLETGKLSALNFPRDLWSKEYQTKMNALYQYGFDRYPETPEQFPKEVLGEATGVRIEKTIILRLDQVSQLIDILGGVEIDVPEYFVDTQFPRSNVDIRTETDPAKLYETIVFEQGVERMSGERALQYIRSRKSSNLDEGTDDARGRRQQQVISAMIQQLSQPSIIKYPELLGKLYRFYNENFSTQISIIELVEIANRLRSKLEHIQFSPSSLSIQDAENEGVIVHPPTEKYGQWVYEIVNEPAFQAEVRTKLNIDN